MKRDTFYIVTEKKEKTHLARELAAPEREKHVCINEKTCEERKMREMRARMLRNDARNESSYVEKF